MVAPGAAHHRDANLEFFVSAHPWALTPGRSVSDRFPGERGQIERSLSAHSDERSPARAESICTLALPLRDPPDPKESDGNTRAREGTLRGGHSATRRDKARQGATDKALADLLPNGMRVLSQRTTLKALGVNGTARRADQIAKTRGKTCGSKLDVLDHENDDNTRDLKDLNRGSKLRFLPIRGGALAGGASPLPVRPQARMRAPAPGTGASLRKLSRRQSTGQNPPRVAEAFASLRPKKEPACAGSCRELSP